MHTVDDAAEVNSVTGNKGGAGGVGGVGDNRASEVEGGVPGDTGGARP